MRPRFPFVAVEAPAGRVEELGVQLFELGATGIEERAGRPGMATLVACFASRARAERALGGLRQADGRVAAELGEMVGDEWRDAYKKHFAPFALTETVTVAPPWAGYAARRAGEKVLVLDPGRAFGTGLHASTALVAEAMERRAPSLRGRRLLDVGTGSGILALAGLLLGAKRAVGIDTDAAAIDVARENAAHSGLAARIKLRPAPIDAIRGRFGWVVANIEARVLVAMAEPLLRRVAPGGTLALSGILAQERAELLASFLGPGGRTAREGPRADFTLLETRRRGRGPEAWATVVLRRRSPS
ncbi:MAG: 50S ribosomal protein L11 methyltransferase [Deltaproteobacteria bacterium]|nr:50S ribosomal protein L11 methyltransferase [Deltaproteobacteria bacterium]